MNKPDAAPGGIQRRMKLNCLACNPDRSRIGRVDAGDDAAERRFASTVLADQRVACATLDGKGDVIEGHNAGKAFREAGDFNQSGHVRLFYESPRLPRRGGWPESI